MTARIWILGAAAVVGLSLLSGAVTSERRLPPQGQPSPRREAPASRAKVDINTATAADLQRLPGITRKLSARIIANRPYRKIDDLVRRKVLGRKQLAAIKEYITAGPSGATAGSASSQEASRGSPGSRWP